MQLSQKFPMLVSLLPHSESCSDNLWTESRVMPRIQRNFGCNFSLVLSNSGEIFHRLRLMWVVEEGTCMISISSELIVYVTWLCRGSHSNKLVVRGNKGCREITCESSASLYSRAWRVFPLLSRRTKSGMRCPPSPSREGSIRTKLVNSRRSRRLSNSGREGSEKRCTRILYKAQVDFGHRVYSVPEYTTRIWPSVTWKWFCNTLYLFVVSWKISENRKDTLPQKHFHQQRSDTDAVRLMTESVLSPVCAERFALITCTVLVW